MVSKALNPVRTMLWLKEKYTSTCNHLLHTNTPALLSSQNVSYQLYSNKTDENAG